jgi:sensor histidine kinase regulating citrate/malate metabolism
LTYDLIILCYLGKPIISNLYKRQLELAEIKNIMLQNSLNETEQSFELWKKSIHDYKNNIIALTQLAEEGNVDEIKAYLKEESKMLDNRMFYIKTGNSVADAIINTKCNKAKNKGINFSVNSVFEEQNSVSDVDLASILGNLLDNAIEASEKEDKPYISVNINKQKSFLIINISNKYTGNFSNTTQKKDKIFHGIGLKSVNRIVKKYGGQLNISRENDMIITKILIP